MIKKRKTSTLGTAVLEQRLVKVSGRLFAIIRRLYLDLQGTYLL